MQVGILCLLAIALAGCGEPPRASLDEPLVSDNEEVRNRGEGKDAWWDALPRSSWADFERVGVSEEWFEVYRIDPGIFAIYEPGQFEEVISYLIVGSESALLFDSGLGIADISRLVEELTDKDVAVLNSHTHYDHVGGNHLFDRIYGTDLEFTRDNAAGRVHGDVAEFVGPGWIWKPAPDGFSAQDYTSRPFAITRRVVDGELLDLGGVELEILLTPGHAPDSLCLLDRRRRLLFSGDTLYPATLYAHLPGSSFADYLASAARLSALAGDVDEVLPGHNEVTMTGADLLALEAALDSVQRADAEYVVADGLREYMFERFSILVNDPPPWLGE